MHEVAKMRTPQSFVDVETNITLLFSRLTLPDTGISTNWLTDIKMLRKMITDNTQYYGCAVTTLVARLVSNLQGSAVGAWAISNELEELLDTIRIVEHNLLSMDDERIEPSAEPHSITLCLN